MSLRFYSNKNQQKEEQLYYEYRDFLACGYHFCCNYNFKFFKAFILYTQYVMYFTAKQQTEFSIIKQKFEQNYWMIYSSESQSDKQFFYEENEQLEQLQQARRVQMMKKIGVFQQDQVPFQQKQSQNLNPFAQDQMGQLKKRFDKNNSSEKKDKQYEAALVEQSAKKLRAKNTQLFLETMKAELHCSFTTAIAFISNVQQHYNKQFPFIFQYMKQDHFKIYCKLKAKKPTVIEPQQVLQFLKKMYNQLIPQQNNIKQIDQRLFNPITLLWFFCLDLKVGLRKINLFDISKMNLECIYDLNYHSKIKKGKRHVQTQIMERSLRQCIEKMEMSMDNCQFEDIDSYAFNPNSKSQKGLTDQARKKQMMNQQTKVKDMLNNYPDNFYQLFCPISRQWKLINAKNYTFVQIQQVKQKVFQRKAIIGFFSTRIIDIQKAAKPIISFRQLKQIQIKDLTCTTLDILDIFADSMKQILKRRNRLSCKIPYKQYIKLGNFQRPQEILADLEYLIISTNKKVQNQMMMEAFPQTRKQMRYSQFFTVPSMIDKYKILKPGAASIERKFQQEEVYLKKDLLRATSRLMWVDCNRMVRQGQQPVKTTQNRQGNKTQLFCYSQTQPFCLKRKQSGDFIQDEQYKSIYVPPNFKPPQDCLIVKQKIGYVCKRNKFTHSRIVQGFNRANMKLVPNQIGFLIYKKDFEQIMKLHVQRVQKLLQTKQSREYQKTVSAWKKLFKQILIKQKIKKEIY